MKEDKTPMMKCGHSANATNEKGEPVCVICIGIDPGATKIDEAVTLEGRKAICVQCKDEKTIKDSSPELAFFEHRPDNAKDWYYCGCRGWD